jgi:hypothetical protein
MRTTLACRVPAAVLALLLSGCSTEATSPYRMRTPAYDWMNTPDNGNVRIARYQEGYFISWTDPVTGLRALHTNIPLSSACGPQVALDPIDVQDVGLLTDPKIHELVKGPVAIIIRDVSQPGTCFGKKLVAEGSGDLTGTDNDFFGSFAVSNTNSFGWIAEGNVTTLDGASHHYNGHLRVTARFLGGDPTDPANYDVQARTLVVNLR